MGIEVQISIVFDRPLSPKQAKALVELLRSTVKTASDYQATLPQSTELTRRRYLDRMDIRLVPKDK